MGFFLVFFPEDQQKNFPSSSPTLNSILKRNHLFTRAQSTISVCALLIFVTLIVFTLSSFEPNNDLIKSHHHYRRFLSQNPHAFPANSGKKSPALQGLGTLYTRGTNAVKNLVICHVPEHVTAKELKLFLRGFYWSSGLVSDSDLLFIFDSLSTIEMYDQVIREESDVFLKLVDRYSPEFGNRSKVNDFPAKVDLKTGKNVEKGEPIWGRKIKINNNDNNNSSLNNVGEAELTQTELTRASYGSVVGFGIEELDPENSLSGFLDRVPIGLRRWAGYPMILGRVRRKFKRVMVVDVKDILLLGDPLGGMKSHSHSPESVFLYSTANEKHGRKNKNSHMKVISPSLIIGGERGVRRLSAAMLTEIVRTTTRSRHKPSSLTESALLSQLVANEFLQKSIRFVTSAESIPDPSSLSGVALSNMTVVRRGNSNLDIDEVVMKHICSFPIDSSVYTEC
ncbi:hypothetical protein HanPI659440_Chr13g0501031 [Helianthus annuus]|nr:hypothetical protein HanPI659440_Chr13g0501031 [Helianthus annuus]